MGTINSSMKAVQQTQADLGQVDNLPPLGHDLNKVDESKHEIHSQVDAITAGTASVVNLTAGEPTETDYTAVGCAITTISSNLTEMSKGVKLLAALMEDEAGGGHKLMGAARMLAGAVSDLLRSVEPVAGEPRQTVLTAAGSIGQASGDLLRHMGEGETDEKFQVGCLPLTVSMAVVSPTISSPVCQEQLVEAGKLVDRSVETCVKACRSANSDGELLKQVAAAAGVVSQALSDLLQHVRHYASCGEPIGRYDQATDTIMNVTENIFTSMGDAGVAARETAQALRTLAQAARGVAASTMEPQAAAAMLDSAQYVMEGSAMLIHEAHQALVHPGDAESQQRLAQVAKAVSHSLNNCVNCLPGQKDVDMALRSIGETSKKLLVECVSPVVQVINISICAQAVRGLLGNPNEPVNELSYFDCIESVMENSKVLGESMAGISQHCKTGDVLAFGESVSLASKALCGLTEAAAQVLSAATIVAKHTSALCNACRLASSKTSNPVARRQFVQSAKEVANTTANLVKTIKVNSPTDQNVE
ncbi:hypothetical protein GOODEAATRI_000352, partial [Goodea atripinnis]